jgi:putative transposase
MREYRRSAHAVFDIKYHIVWIVKYRHKILRGRLAERARDLIRQTCEARGVVSVRGAVSPDQFTYWCRLRRSCRGRNWCST